MALTKEEINQACDEAYKKAGHNAYFANGFKMGVEFALNQNSKWALVDDRTPITYIEGYWDGKKSDQVVAQDSQGKNYLATVYEGTLDGCKFINWYDDNDYEITNKIIKWRELPID